MLRTGNRLRWAGTFPVSAIAALAATLIVGTLFAAEPEPVDIRYLDEMDDLAAWKSLASDGASASIREGRGVDGGGRSVILEFDLANTAGYAAARRVLPTSLPDDYEISFWMRGEAGRNHFEVKFVDASGDNVWWFRRANFTFSGDWQQVRIKRRQIEFAWGTTTDRTLRRFESIEFVVSAGDQGGRGNLWFDRLALKPLKPPDASAKPTATASSELAGHPAAHAIDGRNTTSWRSDAGAEQTLTSICDMCASSAESRLIGRRACMPPATPSKPRRTALRGDRCARPKPATAAVIRIFCRNRRRATSA